MSTVYISFCAGVDQKTMQNLIGVAMDQINKGATHLYFLFSTPGGQVQPGIAAYNILKGLPVNTTMHNVGGVDSIGNAIFLAGKTRIACTHSTFMFHGVAVDSGATRLDEKMLNESLQLISADQAKIAGIIAQETSLQRTQIDGMFLNAQTLDAASALRVGIVGSVADVNIPTGANLLQLVF